MSSMFNQQNPAASASSSKPAGDDSKPPLPKGVVLDKDGKPYVYTNDNKPAQPVYSGSAEQANTPISQLPHLHLRRLMASIDQASRPQKRKLQLYLNPHLEHKQNDNPNGRPRRCRNPLPQRNTLRLSARR